MARVAGCPDVSLPHRHRYRYLSTSASTVGAMTMYFFRNFASSLSGTSFPWLALDAPLPLLVLGAMAAEGGRGIESGEGAAVDRGEGSSSGSRKKKGVAVPRLGKARGVNEECPSGFLFFAQKMRRLQ